MGWGYSDRTLGGLCDRVGAKAPQLVDLPVDGVAGPSQRGHDGARPVLADRARRRHNLRAYGSRAKGVALHASPFERRSRLSRLVSPAWAPATAGVIIRLEVGKRASLLCLARGRRRLSGHPPRQRGLGQRAQKRQVAPKIGPLIVASIRVPPSR